MVLETKKLADISLPDLQALLDGKVPEGKLIDYKRELPGSTDADKKEFLFDISSFANASGGYLTYGIEEENGIPTQLTGIVVANPDEELRRFQSLILDGIEPRIMGLELRFVSISDSKYVLVIHIPKSWLMPHMVIFKGTDKFYTRNSGGKHRLDVGELRSLFTLSDTMSGTVKKFRNERLSLIAADETPIQLDVGPKTILHLVPLESFSVTSRISLSNAMRVSGDLMPLASSGFNTRINLDGLLLHNGGLRNNAASYLQLFHNGIIETVDSSMIGVNGNMKLIPLLLPNEWVILDDFNKNG
jgi:hypothetical protein